MRVPDRGDCRAETPLLEFRNVTVVREGRKLLDRISLLVHGGEQIAILGPNGSGKTTLLRTINREYYPSTAQEDPPVFRIMGQDLWNIADLRSYIGVVSDTHLQALPWNITGLEVVLSGFFSSANLHRRRITPEMKGRAEELLGLLGVYGLENRRLSTLSAGEARRFLIARALVKSPRILLLDEPTSGLDLHGLSVLRSALRRIAHSGVSILLATHQLHDIAPETTRVLLMKGGRFVRDGRKEAVLNSREISALFGVHVNVREEDGWYYATGF